MNSPNSANISFFRSQRFTFLRLFMALALVPVILLDLFRVLTSDGQMSAAAISTAA